MYLAMVGMMGILVLAGCGGETGDEAGDSADSKETAAEAEKTETSEISGYNLLLSDESDGSVMDEGIWNYEPHEPGWTNNELREYITSTDNVFVRDG